MTYIYYVTTSIRHPHGIFSRITLDLLPAIQLMRATCKYDHLHRLNVSNNRYETCVCEVVWVPVTCLIYARLCIVTIYIYS